MGCSSSIHSLDNNVRLKPEISISRKDFNSSDNPSEYILKNSSLSQESYFDLLASIDSDSNLETFLMENIVLNSILIIKVLVNLNKLTKILDKVSKNSNLRVLSLTSLHGYGNYKGKYLYLLLTNCMQLTKLVLDDIELDDSDSDYIIDIITMNSPNLHYLDISSNKFNETKHNIVSSFIKNTNLKTIILKNLKLDEYLPILLSSLENITSLDCLDLSKNRIGDSINAFRNLFCMGVYIQKLTLESCNINDEYFSELLEILQINQVLEELNVNMNEITILSSNILSIFFTTNKTIKFLYLQRNKINQSELIAFLDKNDIRKCVFDEIENE